MIYSQSQKSTFILSAVILLPSHSFENLEGIEFFVDENYKYIEKKIIVFIKLDYEKTTTNKML